MKRSMADYSLKCVRKKFQAQGIYHTDNKLAAMLREYCPAEVRDVYDPTCGRGALLAEFPDEVPKFGQELEVSFIDDCNERLTNFTGVAGDTLANPAFMDRKFHAIVANYPFSVEWKPLPDDMRFQAAPTIPTQSRADYAFILHCLYYLADDGVAVVMAAPGVLYRGQREGTIRRWLIEQNYVDRVVHIPGGYFEDTQIAVCLLILRKDRTHTHVIFEDWENGICRKVKRAEIAENKFNLSVNMYIGDMVAAMKRRDKPELSAAALEKDCRRLAVENLKRGLDASFLVREIDPTLPPLDEFIDELQEVLDEYRRVLRQRERDKYDALEHAFINLAAQSGGNVCKGENPGGAVNGGYVHVD